MPDRIRLGACHPDDARFALVRMALTVAAGAAAVGWAANFAPRNSPWPTLAAVAGAPLAAFAAVGAYRRARACGGPELTLGDDGFVLHGDSERTVADADVTELGSVVEVVARNGQPVAYRRRLALGLAGGDRLDLVHDDDTLTADPLGPLVRRLLQRHQVAARNELAAGGAVAGDGWTLTARELRFTAEGAVDVLPLDRLAACQEVDSVVCTWVTGVAEPVFRRPSGTPNALLLLALLENFAPSATSSPAITPAPAVWGEPADAGLGRLISERNTAGDERRVATVLALAMVAGAGFAWWMVGNGRAGFELHLLAYGGPLAAVAAGVHAWRNRVNLFQHFAGGVARTTARGTRAVRFADLRAFSYVATDHSFHGLYTQTRVVMTFEPGFRYTARVNVRDANLEVVRERATAAVGEWLGAELRAGRSVPWGKGLVLTPDGLGLPDGTVVPYPQVCWVWFYDGNHLMVHRADLGRTVAILPAAMPNLLPGLAVLDRLYQQAKTLPVG